MGPRKGDLKELKILNRKIKWEVDGITLEADERHVIEALKALDLENAKGVATPAVRPPKEMGSEGRAIKSVQGFNVGEDGRPLCQTGGSGGEPSDVAELDDVSTKLYRSVTARFLYLSQDRPEITFAVRECSKKMSAPRQCDLVKLKRLGRYLKQHRRVKSWFYWGGDVSKILCQSDSDWAGDREGRKSVSGGVLRVGHSVVKHWSKDQGNVSKSSAEAELYACNYAADHALGMQSMLRDMGIEAHVTVEVDSSAAIGVIGRIGLGKLRHIEVQDLWLQHATRSGKIVVRKVKGELNDADLGTKPLTFEAIRVIMGRMDCEFVYEDTAQEGWG